LGATGVLVGDRFLDDVAALDRREVVASGPQLGPELLVEGVGSRLERLEGGGAVAEGLETEALEVRLGSTFSIK
jgi:hypothetical protein